MKIDLPSTLTASYTRHDDDWNEIEGPGRVVVKFGQAEIVSLEAVRDPHGFYDTRLDEEEAEEVIQETVAKWLREKLA